MKNWGIFLIFFGIMTGYKSITMDTSVSTDLGERVINFSLMNLQSNLLIGSGIAFISGIILIGVSSKSEENASKLYRTCPYCAEQIKVQATICRFCQRQLSSVDQDQLLIEQKRLNDIEVEKKINLSSRIVLIFIILYVASSLYNYLSSE